LKQLAAVRDQAPDATGPVKDLTAKLKAANLPPERAAKVAALMAEKVFPALDRQRALVTELRAKATHDAGVWRLPDGAAYYAAAASAATTTEIVRQFLLGEQLVDPVEAGHAGQVVSAHGLDEDGHLAVPLHELAWAVDELRVRLFRIGSPVGEGEGRWEEGGFSVLEEGSGLVPDIAVEGVVVAEVGVFSAQAGVVFDGEVVLV
jgi:hypothetical protein